jgi:hypothetical protein
LVIGPASAPQSFLDSKQIEQDEALRIAVLTATHRTHAGHESMNLKLSMPECAALLAQRKPIKPEPNRTPNEKATGVVIS